MLYNDAIDLATKGRIDGGPYSWFIIKISQVRANRRRNGNAGVSKPQRYYVGVTFEYNKNIYTQRRLIDLPINVTSNMLSLDVIDGQLEISISFDIIEEPKVNIKFEQDENTNIL